MQAGLCDHCAWQKVIRSGRGSTFSLCTRSKVDPAFPKYPRVPVGSCPGFEARPPARDGADRHAGSARGPAG